MDGVCFDKICFETTGVHRGGLLHRFLLDVLPVQPDSVRSCSDPVGAYETKAEARGIRADVPRAPR